jgi:transcriptional repressor NrdR
MFCINCFNPSTAVANSRPHKKRPSVWRRRSCGKCGAVFTTHERPSLADNKTITLSDGSEDTFNLGKLTISISKAFHHSQEEAEYSSFALAQTVEDTLSTQLKTITPEDIEAVTHQTLKQYDELAAMQYAAQHQLISSVKKRGRPSLVSRAPRNRQSPSR